MRKKLGVVLLVTFALLMMVACTKKETASVKEPVEQALKAAGMDNINIDEDREKGVVTLKGDVNSEADKARAAQVAQSAAGSVVIKNELAVKPQGAEDRAEEMLSETDKAIKDEWQKLNDAQKWEDINADVQNGVLTLKGEVASAAVRTRVEGMATKLPGVKQIVNELNIKGQEGERPATTTTK